MTDQQQETSNIEVSFEDQVEQLLHSCTLEQLNYISKELQTELQYRVFSEKKIRELRDRLMNEKMKFHDNLKIQKALIFDTEKEEVEEEFEVSYSSEPDENDDDDEVEEMPVVKPKIKRQLQQKKIPVKKNGGSKTNNNKRKHKK
ncbi:MAG TPA: hypothetical protein PLS50_09370 [Candidatus Dojkabacteria bacterium]|nr:hypothetical protein [Candidatus Dojkabacteria bacterium]